MAQHYSRPPLPTAPQPFSEAQDPAPTSGLFWARLLTYRPLFLLGGLWLALVCVSAIAYQGLMFNEPVEDTTYDTTYEEAPLSIASPKPQALPSTPEIGSEAVEEVEVEPSQSGTVALWGLLSLVGLCAFGCFVLTQQIKASARPKRKKVRPVAKGMAPVRPPQPKRLAPYLPQRDNVVVPGIRMVDPLPQPLMAPAPQSTALPQRPPSAPRPVPSARPQTWPQPLPGELPPQPRTPMVVNEVADLSLDWPEGSVAHALDVRQRRSLSSFM